MNKVSARLASLQKQMELKLEEIRCQHEHQGAKGSNVEGVVRDFLREYLPPSFRIGEGEAIDTNGRCSKQLDVVILNENHPYLNDLTRPSLFFIEGVGCAGEVKTCLTSEELDRALENGLRFKLLEPFIQHNELTFCSEADAWRFLHRRPFFVFALESRLSAKAIAERICRFNDKHGLAVNTQIDAVFTLDKGFVINFGDGSTSYKATRHGEQVTGVVYFDRSDDDAVLLNLLSWLGGVMPKSFPPAAIIFEYLRRRKG